MKSILTVSTTCLLLLLVATFDVTTASAQCRDPWINQAYQEVAGRAPIGMKNTGECAIWLYNNGSWNSYPELKGYVQQFRTSSIATGYGLFGSGNSVMLVNTGGVSAISLLDANGNIVAQGGLNIVAQGGGNIVAQGGGNKPQELRLVNTNGSNVISNGGLSMDGITTNTLGFNRSTGYSLQAGETKRAKTSGIGSIVIK